MEVRGKSSWAVGLDFVSLIDDSISVSETVTCSPLQRQENMEEMWPAKQHIWQHNMYNTKRNLGEVSSLNLRHNSARLQLARYIYRTQLSKIG